MNVKITRKKKIEIIKYEEKKYMRQPYLHYYFKKSIKLTFIKV